jgi:predicted metal-dependent peptidase
MDNGFTDARLRLMAGRIVAQNRWPYLSGVLFALKPVEVPKEEVPTLAVDSGWRLYYSKEFVTTYPVEVIATGLLHEAMHCVLDHMGRFEAIARNQNSSSQVWNFCGDAHINKALDEAGMPWGEFTPVRFEQLEKYGVRPENSTELAHNKIVEYLKNNNESLEPPSDCGSAAGGERRSYEAEDKDKNTPAMPGSDRESVKDVLAIDINRRKQAGEEVGEQMLKWASDRLNPTVDWRKQLGHSLRGSYAVASGKKDYSYGKPSRKQGAVDEAGMNVLLPSLRNPTPPNIAIVVDTSGSITRAELDRYATELFGILKSVGSSSKVEVVGCDTKVTGPFRVRKASDIADLDLKGGGGTDLRVGIDFAIRNLRSEIIVIATDGETPWHSKCPNSSKTYIGLFTTENGAKSSPSWVLPIFVK